MLVKKIVKEKKKFNFKLKNKIGKNQNIKLMKEQLKNLGIITPNSR